MQTLPLLYLKKQRDCFYENPLLVKKKGFKKRNLVNNDERTIPIRMAFGYPLKIFIIPAHKACEIRKECIGKQEMSITMTLKIALKLTHPF